MKLLRYLRAIKAIQSSGGVCLRSYSWDSKKDLPRATWQKILLKMIGADLWSPVTSVCFWGGRITKEAIASISEFPAIKSLVFDGVVLPSSGIEFLGCKSSLEELYLQGSNVADSDLNRLMEFSNLRRLNLEDTGIGDAGAKYLERITSLEWLSVARTSISSKIVRILMERLPELKVRWFNEDAKEAMKSLEDLEPLFDSDIEGNVVEVTLWSEHVDDSTCQKIRAFPHLKSLSIWCLSSPGKVSNAGLRELCNMTGLQHLYLVGSQVDDVGVRYLDNLQNLNTLDLRGINFSNSTAEQFPFLPSLRRLYLGEINTGDLQTLHKKYPNCEIITVVPPE